MASRLSLKSYGFSINPLVRLSSGLGSEEPEGVLSAADELETRAQNSQKKNMKIMEHWHSGQQHSSHYVGSRPNGILSHQALLHFKHSHHPAGCKSKHATFLLSKFGKVLLEMMSSSTCHPMVVKPQRAFMHADSSGLQSLLLFPAAWQPSNILTSDVFCLNVGCQVAVQAIQGLLLLNLLAKRLVNTLPLPGGQANVFVNMIGQWQEQKFSELAFKKDF